MSTSSTNQSKKNQPGRQRGKPSGRAAARETAARMRAESDRQERRKRLAIQVAVSAVVAAIVVGTTIGLLSQRDDAAAALDDGAPANTEDGAIVRGNPDAPTTVTVYEDFGCPACRDFEVVSGDLLADYADGDDVRLEYRPIAFLDRASTDRYSTRALNAAAAVVDHEPDAWPAFHDALYAEQPAEGGAGLSDDRLVEIAAAAGADDPAVAEAIRDLAFEDWASAVTGQSADAGVDSTPTVLADGEVVPDRSPAGIQAAVDAAG